MAVLPIVVEVAVVGGVGNMDLEQVRIHTLLVADVANTLPPQFLPLHYRQFHHYHLTHRQLHMPQGQLVVVEVIGKLFVDDVDVTRTKMPLLVKVGVGVVPFHTHNLGYHTLVVAVVPPAVMRYS